MKFYWEQESRKEWYNEREPSNSLHQIGVGAMQRTAKACEHILNLISEMRQDSLKSKPCPVADGLLSIWAFKNFSAGFDEWANTLSVRTRRVFCRAGISSWQTLLCKTEEDFMEMPNFGATSLNELQIGRAHV